MALPTFITPTQLLTLAPLGQIPRADIPGPQFRGRVGVVTHTGASTGVLTVGGFPVDATPVVIKVVVPGDLGTSDGAGALFAISTDGGLTFDDPVLSLGNAQANNRWDYEIGITGMVISALNGSGTPNSYLLNDTWTLTSTASPMLLQVCTALSDLFRKWAFNTAQKIDEIDEADRTMLAQLGRHWLVAGRGNVPEDWQRLAKLAEKRFELESKGDLNLNSTPDPNGFVFPDYEQARAPYRVCELFPFH